ncbi:hypothetical protein BGX27_005821, partial [Mortierella sp. AM989]
LAHPLMVEIQLFRLIRTTEIEKIPIHNVDGQKFVYWDDIEQIFPEVKHVENDEVAVTLMRDSEGNRIKPHRIKHCPGVVLDVVLSTTVEPIHVDSPIATT